MQVMWQGARLAPEIVAISALPARMLEAAVEAEHRRVGVRQGDSADSTGKGLRVE
jgi:hypothetical protein